MWKGTIHPQLIKIIINNCAIFILAVCVLLNIILEFVFMLKKWKVVFSWYFTSKCSDSESCLVIFGKSRSHTVTPLYNAPRYNAISGITR